MNGQPRGNIIPERGLRQGYPLSPFVFILCTEALVSLLNHAENKGKITQMRATCSCPSVSHLIFGDDNFFSCKVWFLYFMDLRYFVFFITHIVYTKY